MSERPVGSAEREPPGFNQQDQAEALNGIRSADDRQVHVQAEADSQAQRLEEARKSPWLIQEEAKLKEWSASQRKIHRDWQVQNVSVQAPEAPAASSAGEPIPLVLDSQPSTKPEKRRDRLRRHGKQLVHKIASLGKPEELRDTPQWRENIKLLKDSGEVGRLLLPFYKEALEYYPHIAKVKIVPVPSGGKAPVFARAKWQTGKHEVHMQLGREAVNQLSKMANDHPETKKHFAEMLNLQPEDMTPEQVTAFIFLHELGHTEEFIRHEDDPHQLSEHRKRGLAAMPVPGLDGSGRFWSEDVQKEIRENWTEISARQDVETMEELFIKQQRAHRHSNKERYADNFAANIINTMAMEGKR